jgi:hypothetical protein
MNPNLADSLNRIGLVLAFLSFWFVAPEFIGEKRLRLWEQALARGLLRMPTAMEWVFRSLSVVMIGIFIIRWLSTSRTGTQELPQVPQWFLLGAGLTSSAFLISRIVVEPIVSKLANDDRVRQTSLVFGAVLFTIGFVLQFVATFQTRSFHA